MDSTSTAMGSRLLSRWLNRPLRSKTQLESRQQVVGCLIADYRFEPIAELLKSIGDLERILARLGLRSARPRDLAKLRDSYELLPALQNSLTEIKDDLVTSIAEKISTFPEHAALLQKAIEENPPIVIREGGVIAEGYDEELDELRNLSSNAGPVSYTHLTLPTKA